MESLNEVHLKASFICRCCYMEYEKHDVKSSESFSLVVVMNHTFAQCDCR